MDLYPRSLTYQIIGHTCVFLPCIYVFIKINGMPIERVTEFKFLGVLIDSNLTWSPHCNYIANKLSRICGVVSRLKHYVPTHIVTIIYNSLFLSHISYGITSWGFTMCTRISKLQKKVIRFLTNSKFNSHTAPTTWPAKGS